MNVPQKDRVSGRSKLRDANTDVANTVVVDADRMSTIFHVNSAIGRPKEASAIFPVSPDTSVSLSALIVPAATPPSP